MMFIEVFFIFTKSVVRIFFPFPIIVIGVNIVGILVEIIPA